MNKSGAGLINWLFVIILVSGVIIFFVAGKETNGPISQSNTPIIAGKQVLFHVGDMLDEQKADELEKRFTRLNKKGVFNGTILYAEHGKEVYSGAFGYADFRKRDSMNIDDAFQLASVSKMFTATAIMLLQQDRKLDYEDTLGRFIPEFPYGNITIRQLLTHRSGLSRYMSLADKYWDVNKAISNEDVIDLFVKHIPAPYFKPDRGFHYCNTNYSVLASVVERISGLSFDEFVKRNIFDPLEMDHSFVYKLSADSAIPWQVPVGIPGYRYNRRGMVKVGNYYLNGVMGDKGVYSTVGDLFKYAQSLDNATLVSRENLEEAFAPGSPSYYKRKDNYGFGWRIKTDYDNTVYHFGWWKGFRTYFIRDMQNQRTLIALTNTHRGVSSGVFWDIIKDENRSDELMTIYHSLVVINKLMYPICRKVSILFE